MKGDPIPTRFDPPEDEAINALGERTGLSNAEIVRRAVRLLAARVEEEGSVGFILDDLAPKAKKPPKKIASYSAEEKGKKRQLPRLAQVKASVAGISIAAAAAWLLEMPPIHKMVFAVVGALAFDATDGKMILLGGLHLW
jgi:hypothetical protein